MASLISAKHMDRRGMTRGLTHAYKQEERCIGDLNTFAVGDASPQFLSLLERSLIRARCRLRASAAVHEDDTAQPGVFLPPPAPTRAVDKRRTGVFTFAQNVRSCGSPPIDNPRVE